MNTDGSLNNNNAYNGNIGVVPDYGGIPDRVGAAAKAAKQKPVITPHKEDISPPCKGETMTADTTVPKEYGA